MSEQSYLKSFHNLIEFATKNGWTIKKTDYVEDGFWVGFRLERGDSDYPKVIEIYTTEEKAGDLNKCDIHWIDGGGSSGTDGAHYFLDKCKTWIGTDLDWEEALENPNYSNVVI